MSIVPYAGGVGSSLSLTCAMLTGENYTVWAIKVEANLDAQGLWEAVAPADATAAVDPKKNKTARAYLLGALAEDILLQVSSKKTAAEVWASLKARFVGADRVRAARLATLRGDFDRLRMADGESLDAYAGRIGGMAACYAGLGTTLDDAAMVKKLLDTVPDRFQDSGGGGGEQLMLTAAQWEARRRQRGAGFDHDDDGGSSTTSGGGKRRGRCYNYGVSGHFRRDYRNRKKAEEEKALLADVDDQPGLY
ncbi:unnamed protein product [Alopecurus aequalis]